MASKTEIICACGCERRKEVRTADVKRGWGKFFSKQCKAVEQERRTKRFENLNESNYSTSEHDCHEYAMGQQEIADRGY